MTEDKPRTELEPLLAKLAAVESSTLNISDSVTTCWYRNPDGPEAADTIEGLLLRVESLTEALKQEKAHTLDAVKGRQDFRNAYRRLLPIQRAAEVLSKAWRTSGRKGDGPKITDALLDAVNGVDVAFQDERKAIEQSQ